MPQQLTFAQAEYAAKKKLTRREQFLAEMEQVLPWAALIALIKPHYYREEDRGPGHPPIGLERMLRMYLLQQWYSLGDEALEDAIYDSQAFRHFLGIDLGRESVPDATTLLGFRRLLETQGLQVQIFETINALLRERGLMMNQGTLVDAASSTHPPRPRTKPRHGIHRCTRRARATSGTSG
jgi:IS5 family transposase